MRVTGLLLLLRACALQVVSCFPDGPGKWQLVDSFPDFKVQIVGAFADYKITYVGSFPGLP